MDGIRRVLLRHVENNIIKYILCIVSFTAGIVMGALFAFNIDSELAISLAEGIRTTCHNATASDFDTFAILKTSLIKNIRNTMLIFAGGISVWLMPIAFAVLAVCGFSYSFTLVYLSVNFGGGGFAMGFASIILNLIITVPVYIIMSVLAVNNAYARRNNRADSSVFVSYVICFLLLFAIIFPCVLADAFAVPEFIKQICVNLAQ